LRYLYKMCSFMTLMFKILFDRRDILSLQIMILHECFSFANEHMQQQFVLFLLYMVLRDLLFIWKLNIFDYDVSEDHSFKSNRISHEFNRGCTLLRAISLVFSQKLADIGGGTPNKVFIRVTFLWPKPVFKKVVYLILSFHVDSVILWSERSNSWLDYHKMIG